MALGAIDADLFKRSPPLLLITEDLKGERLLLHTEGFARFYVIAPYLVNWGYLPYSIDCSTKLKLFFGICPVNDRL